MNVTCNGRNLKKKKKKAETFSELEVTEKAIVVKNNAGNELNKGDISVETIHACMYCETLRNITVIISAEDIYKVSFVMADDSTFQQVLAGIKGVCKNADISEQNKKINGYATALVDKMKAGIELHIVESTDEVKVPICPECGMQCDPSIPYCMECGASIS